MSLSFLNWLFLRVQGLCGCFLMWLRLLLGLFVLDALSWFLGRCLFRR